MAHDFIVFSLSLSQIKIIKIKLNYLEKKFSKNVLLYFSVEPLLVKS